MWHADLFFQMIFLIFLFLMLKCIYVLEEILKIPNF